jgi:hypothetical protein
MTPVDAGDGEKDASDKHEELDWDELRTLSLAPGGFGENRIRLWQVSVLLRLPRCNSTYSTMYRPLLLHASPPCLPLDASHAEIPAASETSHESNNSDSDGPAGTASASASRVLSHRDERQIQLDTERSFVLYPVGEPFPLLFKRPCSYFRSFSRLYEKQRYPPDRASPAASSYLSQAARAKLFSGEHFPPPPSAAIPSF